MRRAACGGADRAREVTRGAASRRVGACDGTSYAAGWVSTLGLKSEMQELVIATFQYSDSSGDGKAYVSMTVNFKAVQHKPVK